MCRCFMSGPSRGPRGWLMVFTPHLVPNANTTLPHPLLAGIQNDAFGKFAMDTYRPLRYKTFPLMAFLSFIYRFCISKGGCMTALVLHEIDTLIIFRLTLGAHLLHGLLDRQAVQLHPHLPIASNSRSLFITQSPERQKTSMGTIRRAIHLSP